MESKLEVPDVSSRPYSLTAQRVMAAPPYVLYRAWTERFDLWFATADSLLMTPEVDAPFYFETQFRAGATPTTAGSCASNRARSSCSPGSPAQPAPKVRKPS
jgi:hypothetical protein